MTDEKNKTIMFLSDLKNLLTKHKVDLHCGRCEITNILNMFYDFKEREDPESVGCLTPYASCVVNVKDVEILIKTLSKSG